MRIWKIVNYGEVSLCHTKFSGTENKDLYGHQLGELNFRYWEWTCGQSGYVFRDFCLKQGIEFIILCLNQGILNRMSFIGR